MGRQNGKGKSTKRYGRAEKDKWNKKDRDRNKKSRYWESLEVRLFFSLSLRFSYGNPSSSS